MLVGVLRGVAQVVFHLSTAATEWWAAAHLGSRLSHRHPLRVAQRDSVADVAEGTGLRIWHDVPAAHGSDETEGECRRDGFRPARGLASLNIARPGGTYRADAPTVPGCDYAPILRRTSARSGSSPAFSRIRRYARYDSANP